MSYATKEQLESLMADIASKVHIPTIGVGGGYAPIGTIIAYMGTTAPQDYLACDGSTYNIADYSQLANFIEAQFGSKNYFGGDGTTTFGVPDLQGEFLRGTGTNSHADGGNGANVGTHQGASSIPMFYTGKTSDGSKGYAGFRFAPALSTGEYTGIANFDKSITKTAKARYLGFEGTNNEALTNTYAFYLRPTNTSVLYCIKAVVAGDVYSTDERVVGTWIDGKPIYQKTITGTFPSTTSTSAFDAGSNIANNVAEIINYYGKATFPGDFPNVVTQTMPMTDISLTFTTKIWGYVNQGILNLWGVNSNSIMVNQPFVFTIQYTKTTD